MLLYTRTANQLPRSPNTDRDHVLAQDYWIVQPQQYRLYYFLCKVLPSSFSALPQTVSSHLYKSEMKNRRKEPFSGAFLSPFVDLSPMLMSEYPLALVPKAPLVQSAWKYVPYRKAF